MWILLVVCLMFGGAASSLRCPDGLECEEPHACCRHPAGDGYACCDQPQFPGVSLRMLPPNTLNEGSGIACPDGGMCPLEYSCLRTPDTSYGCCPWGEAVSCANGRHCCPRGFHCSADGRSCFQSQGFIPPATVDAVQCPDGESQCPNDSTCCLMADASWGCCPIPEASCCEDKIHCCPHGTTCDTAHSRCFAASGEQPLRTKFPARKRALVLARDVQCDTEHKCPDGNTCCQKPSGDWGCCPLVEAVCCSDHIHCCPKGYTCDLAEGTCQKGIDSIPWLAKSSARIAVCCPDHLHCCPTGFHCGPVTGTCVKDGESIPWLEKRPVIVHVTSSSGDVRCDDHFSCPDEQTCCRLPSGQWGCCPLPQAVCCPDHLHCCPTGFRCGPKAGTCVKDGESIPWLEKRPAIVHVTSSSRDVRCDDQVSCSDGQTCCRLPSGAWGCCPFPQAVCCPDHLHCCPNGFRCGPEAGTCMKDGESIPWLEKRPAIVHVTSSNGDVRCDDKMSCTDGQTCCRTKAGGWACCPLPQAVCCSDHAHCCPNGYTCDLAQNGTCVPRSAPSLGLLMALAPSKLKKCSHRKYCLNGQTCCPQASDQWYCCNLSQAVCCEDHRHCCPSGYTCNLKAQTCEKQQPQSLAAEGVQLSVSLNPSRAVTSGHDVPCDAQHYCHDGQTCCLSSTGGWACCPYNKGSCCSDRRHCCPSGFHCSRTGLQCLRKGPLRWDAGVFSSRPTQAFPLL